jgi:hypothetical protein
MKDGDAGNWYPFFPDDIAAAFDTDEEPLHLPGLDPDPPTGP